MAHPCWDAGKVGADRGDLGDADAVEDTLEELSFAGR
jgi:hypothetical protein